MNSKFLQRILGIGTQCKKKQKYEVVFHPIPEKSGSLRLLLEQVSFFLPQMLEVRLNCKGTQFGLFPCFTDFDI